MKYKSVFLSLALLLTLSVGCSTFADSSFDLSGPRMEVTVTRADKSLPIAQVPNLQPGDRLWVHPAFPDGTAVHYLLIVAFLQGATNPPPDDWFKKAETWRKAVRQEGIVVTVPEHSQQALFFLAPQTSGDFSTLRSAVQGKPGAFVRAAQDLNLASQDRLRLDKYLQSLRENSAKDTQALQERSTLLARSLGIKLDKQCFDKPSEEQAPCLMQNTDQMVMEDGHGQSVLGALSSGPEVDLLGAVSATKPAGGGTYSPYIGVIVDVAKVMENLHTAQYQYIPALALPQKEQLNLKLNNPPSFHNPKSVLVAALPPIQPTSVPALRTAEPKQVYCVQKPSLVLPVDAPPQVFATELAHEFSLHLQDQGGKSTDLPVKPDAARGGFVVEGTGAAAKGFASEMSGTLRGSWGFGNFEGPTFHFYNAPAAAPWRLSTEDENALIVGREDTFHLHSDVAVCVEDVTLRDQHEKPVKTSWKLISPSDIEVKVSLADNLPGAATLGVKQFAVAKPVEIPLRTYAEAGHLDQFTIHAGDRQGVLKGARLDQVASLEINGTQFLPATLTRVDKKDELSLSAQDLPPAALQAQQKLTAHLTLKDGRVLDLQTTVEAQRPKLTLVSKNIQSGHSAIHLGSKDDLPLDGRISFFLKSEVPPDFPRTEKIEVAGTDDSFHTVLSLAAKTLSLQDLQTVVAVLDPLKSFGDSAFGPLQFRPVAEDGTAGDWQPLAHLVRVPSLQDVRCPDDPAKQCTLNGERLYLIDSVAPDPDFAHAVSVPTGFSQASLAVPRPNGTLLYIKLRDDPSVVNTAVLPVLPDQP